MRAVKIALIITLAIICAVVFLFLKKVNLSNKAEGSIFKIWTATATNNITTPTPVAQDWTMVTGGDINFARTVDRLIEKYGGSWPLSELSAALKQADYTVVNLESPFLSGGKTTLSGSLILRGNPKGIESLKEAGVDLVNLANNHTPDMGEAGLIETKQLLDQYKISYIGSGQTDAEAYQPVRVKIKDVKVGFTAFCYGTNLEKRGIAVALTNEERAVSIITSLKRDSDLVVVICHCGGEYQTKPNADQEAFARTVIDAGANIYIGHHPHVPQPIEIYNGGLIAYSLGNLVFDQEPIENRDRSALLKINFQGKEIKSYELIPYQIYYKGQPKPVQNLSLKKQIWQLFGLTSETGLVEY